MNTDTAKQPRCPACRSTDVALVSYPREFRPHGKVVVVDLLASQCTSCGAEFTRSAQHNENLARLKARKTEYGGLLLGEEIFALRRRYGITQQAAAKIFGKGKIAFSRYENEVSYPDEGTTNMLELAIEKPVVIKWLADKKGVELPLWAARCEDERKEKLCQLHSVDVADPAARRWAQKELAAPGKRAIESTLLFGAAVRTWNIALDASLENGPAVKDDRFQAAEAAFA